MEDLKKIISANIVALRKLNNLTQIELAKQINYSDKAISRWENGDVIPDVETLNSLAKVFNVSITYFFEAHKDANIKLNNPSKSQTFSQISTISIIWTMLSIIFVYFREFPPYENIWQIFAWGIPLTCLAMLFLFRKWEMIIPKMIIKTVMCWSTLLAIYLTFLDMNLWMIFIIGLPIQLTIVSTSLKKKN